MTTPVNPLPAEDDPEQFYRAYWRSDYWGAIEANADERSRLAAITGFLDGRAMAQGRRPRILDLGCGRGWLTRALSEYGEVLGTDVFEAPIERARELFPDLSFRKTDVRGLLEAEGPGHFDLVVSSEVIEHVADADKPEFVRGIFELLRPGGTAILTTPRGELRDLWCAAHDADQPVEEWLSEAALDTLVTGAGLRVERRTRAHVYGITRLSRILTSRGFRAIRRVLPAVNRLTYGSRIYQVVLLTRPG